MANKRLRALTRADLATLPTISPHPGRLRAQFAAAQLYDAEQAWAAAAIDHYGLVGVQAVNLDQCDGYVLVVPSYAIPAGHPAESPARRPDSAMLIGLWTRPDYARVGLARQVVQSLAARLLGQVDSIEAVASQTGVPGDGLQPDRALLEAVGFTDAGIEHPHGVVLRFDLGATVPEPGRLRSALAALLPWATRPELVQAPSPARVIS